MKTTATPPSGRSSSKSTLKASCSTSAPSRKRTIRPRWSGASSKKWIKNSWPQLETDVISPFSIYFLPPLFLLLLRMRNRRTTRTDLCIITKSPLDSWFCPEIGLQGANSCGNGTRPSPSEMRADFTHRAAVLNDKSHDRVFTTLCVLLEAKNDAITKQAVVLSLYSGIHFVSSFNR